MATRKRNLLLALAILALLLVIFISDVECARGSRGGSTSRSSRTSTSRTSSSSSRFTKTRSRYSGPSYVPSYWATGMAVGYLYGVSSYQTRRRYRDHPNKEPTVCFNEKNLKNGTFGYFICPLPNQDDDMAYCCGSEDEERCCKYFDDPGRIAGLVIGILAFCALVAVGIYCYCTRCRGRGKKGQTGHTLNTNKAHTPGGPDIPMTSPYGVQPPSDGYMPPPQPYDGAMPPPQPYGVPPPQPYGAPPPEPYGGAPQGYDTVAGGLPYNPHPAGDMKPPLPTSDVNPNDPYRAPPGVGFTYSDPNAPGAGYNPTTGQPYPPAPPPPYPSN